MQVGLFRPGALTPVRARARSRRCPGPEDGPADSPTANPQVDRHTEPVGRDLGYTSWAAAIGGVALSPAAEGLRRTTPALFDTLIWSY